VLHDEGVGCELPRVLATVDRHHAACLAAGAPLKNLMMCSRGGGVSLFGPIRLCEAMCADFDEPDPILACNANRVATALAEAVHGAKPDPLIAPLQRDAEMH
jgi:hypothetical protein